MKKTITILLIIICILFSNIYVYADDENEILDEPIIEEQEKKEIETAASSDTKPTINSRRYAIYDRLSGRCLYGKDENKQTAMASTTKIMTSIIVVENCKLTDVVTITAKAAGTGGSRLGLKKDDKITVNDLLYGLMLRSGNDAAVALAIHTAGSVEEIAKLMNQKAKLLGLKNTNFVTPHGLDNENHYTTAYELAKLTDYALKNETIAKIVKTKSTSITINNSPMQINNTNELLGNLEGVYGVKTGFTNNAGRCLVTSVKRDDMDLIIVVLGADTRKDRAKDSMKLIEYAYKRFRVVNVKEIIKKEFSLWRQINESRIYINKAAGNLELELGKITIPKTATDNTPSIEINTSTYLEAPVEKGQRIGTLIVKVGDEILEEITINVAKEVKKRGIGEYFNIIAKVYSGKIKIVDLGNNRYSLQ